jgi:hypothetical protein
MEPRTSRSPAAAVTVRLAARTSSSPLTFGCAITDTVLRGPLTRRCVSTDIPAALYNQTFFPDRSSERKFGYGNGPYRN